MLPLLEKERGSRICWTLFSPDSLSAEAKVAMNCLYRHCMEHWWADRKRSSCGLSGDRRTLLKCSSFYRLQSASLGERLCSWCAWHWLFRDKLCLPELTAVHRWVFCYGCLRSQGSHTLHGLALPGSVIFFFFWKCSGIMLQGLLGYVYLRMLSEHFG